MDAVSTEAAPAVDEVEVMTPRATLESIAEQCEHAIAGRIARRFYTRDALKNLEKRARALIVQEDGHEFEKEFEKVVTTANAVFDQLIAEVKPAGHA